jgi:hypothetical protein
MQQSFISVNSEIKEIFTSFLICSNGHQACVLPRLNVMNEACIGKFSSDINRVATS